MSRPAITRNQRRQRSELTEILDSGRHFVTANKVALAYYCPEIFELARKKKLVVGYGATICGGVHAISVAKRISRAESSLRARS